MDTVSRGDWSRCSLDLTESPVFNGKPRPSLLQRKLDDEAAIEQLLREMNHFPADETTPLVGSRRPSWKDSSRVLWTEALAMISLAVPVIFTYLLEMLPGIVSIVLVGHITPTGSEKEAATTTKEYLDAAALAVMYVNLTAISIGFGLASALDTLCSQAYGAGELHQKARIYLTTGLIVIFTVFFVVMLALNWNACYILELLGQPSNVAQRAATFVKYLVPGIPALFIYELLRKILQAENVALPMFYVAVVGNLVNAGLGYWMVFGLNHGQSGEESIFGSDGWLGAAIARTASNICFPALLIGYLVVSGRWEALWSPPSDGGYSESTRKVVLEQAIAGIPRFISLGIPGALQLCFEWWAFEVLALLSGLLPDAVLAIGTNAILLNIASMVYMLYLGVSIAANVRIGNSLGAHDPIRARLASFLAFFLSLFCALLCATSLLVFRTTLPTLFTHDPEIVGYCSQLLWIAACFQCPDSINAAVQGIFRGSGRQSIGAWLNFVAYYVVGLPIGIALAFPGRMGLEGLWIGSTAGLFVVGAVGSLLVLRSDWEQLSKDAIRRLSHANGLLDK